MFWGQRKKGTYKVLLFTGVNDLKGTIPSELGGLANITSLKLSKNRAFVVCAVYREKIQTDKSSIY